MVTIRKFGPSALIQARKTPKVFCYAQYDTYSADEIVGDNFVTNVPDGSTALYVQSHHETQGLGITKHVTFYLVVWRGMLVWVSSTDATLTRLP